MLRAQQGGIPIALVPLVMVAMNLVYAASAYPFGKLSDRMNHTHLLALGLAVLIGADFVLAINDHWILVLVGVALWGIHMGITQGLLATMIANAVPHGFTRYRLRLFNLVSGISMLIASLVAGLLWDQLGAAFTFYTGGAFCLIALIGLALSTHRQAPDIMEPR